MPPKPQIPFSPDQQRIRHIINPATSPPACVRPWSSLKEGWGSHHLQNGLLSLVPVFFWSIVNLFSAASSCEQCKTTSRLLCPLICSQHGVVILGQRACLREGKPRSLESTREGEPTTGESLNSV